MEDKLYFFQTPEGKFVFDGNAVAIFEYEKEEDIVRLPSVSVSSIDCHRVRFLKTICLILNNSCNLSCKYCYAHQGVYDKPLAQLDYKKAIKAVELIAKSVVANKAKDMTIAFFGGEPLLSFDMIKQIVSYVESMYPDITKKYQITTNGTLITNEISDFMEKYNFNIMISIDGDRAKHNKYRCFKNGRGSYDNVVKGINFINNKYLLNARITVTDINPEIYEYIDDILNLSIQRVTFAIDYKVSEDVFIKYIDAIKKLASKYINDIKNGIFYDITNLTRVMSYAIFHNKCRAHCNAGVSYITMSADGLYYQCPRFVGMSNFCMGENSLSVSNYMNKLNKNLGSSAADRCMDCKNCNFVYVCGGVCMHHAYVSHGGIFDKVKRECVERTVVFQEGLRVLCSLSVSERRAFLLFLTSIWQKNNIKGGDG